MAWKCALLVIGVSVAAVAYWLYSPVPDGFSPECTRQIQIMCASGKVVDLVATVGSYLGFGSHLNIFRQIMNYLLSLSVVPDPEVTERDLVFDGVPVRLHEPVNHSGDVSGIVYYHGGGWIFGNPDLAASSVRKMCKETNSVVISVDYRLAPEAVFPAAFEDCVKATKYFVTNAAQFHVDPQRIAVAGQSAGGNLAAAVALKLRDDQFQPAVKLQVLIYPILQGLDFALPSMMQNENAANLPRSGLPVIVNLYLEGNADKAEAFLNNDHVSPAVKKMKVPYIDVTQLPSKYLVGYEKPSVETGNETMWNELKHKLLSPYFSPLVAERLDGLPLTYMFTAEHDVLRDDGFLYAQRLRDSGVRVEHANPDVGIHGILLIYDACPQVDKMFQEMTKFIANNL